MRRRTLMLAGAAVGLAAAREAAAQSSLRPDPTPRVPPQPGQGVPLDERRFLRDAVALSAAQAEAGRAAAGGLGEEEVRRLAEALAQRHARLAEELRALATARGLPPGQAIAEAEAPSNPRVASALARLRGPAPGGPRDFLAMEMEVHPVLVELYQTEASHAQDRELGSFAIRSLVGIQEDFAALARLGERHGLRPPERLLANPPQYGPGAGPSR